MQGLAEVQAQQQALLEACGRLDGDAALADFKARVRALLAAEAALLDGAPAALREAQQDEAEEFEAFADEVLSAEHFDAEELRRFATAWTLGHLRTARDRLGG